MKRPQTKQMKALLKARGFYQVSSGAGTTEYGHDTAKIVAQLVNGADGFWAILTDDFEDIASGKGAASFEKKFLIELRKRGGK